MRIHYPLDIFTLKSSIQCQKDVVSGVLLVCEPYHLLIFTESRCNIFWLIC
jgi:hypothetical protein